MKRTKTTRRDFLKTSAALAAGPMIFPRLSLANPPSERLQHASIGVGGMGKSDLASTTPMSQMILPLLEAIASVKIEIVEVR